jgi:hypothetical protein
MNEELAREQAPHKEQEELKDEERGTALPSLPNKAVPAQRLAIT